MYKQDKGTMILINIVWLVKQRARCRLHSGVLSGELLSTSQLTAVLLYLYVTVSHCELACCSLSQ